MTPRPHDFGECWCGKTHRPDLEFSERGDDPRVRPSDSRAESQAGSNGPSGSLNPRSERDCMSQDEFNSRMDAGEDPYPIVADEALRAAR